MEENKNEIPSGVWNASLEEICREFSTSTLEGWSNWYPIREARKCRPLFGNDNWSGVFGNALSETQGIAFPS